MPKTNPLDELKFCHMPVGKTFVAGCELFVKISPSIAIGVTFGKKHRFKRKDPVSLISRLNYSSYTEGSCDGRYDRKKMIRHAEKLIADYRAQVLAKCVVDANPSNEV